MENNQDYTAHDSLAAISDARQAAAERLVTPWWYHPALGLAIGAYTLALSVDNSQVAMFALFGFIGVVSVLTKAYQRITGVWLWGGASGKASKWAYAIGAVTGVVAVSTWMIGRYTSMTWPVWILSAAVAIVVVVFGRRYDVVLRRELRGTK
jgi:hypothetical protein